MNVLRAFSFGSHLCATMLGCKSQLGVWGPEFHYVSEAGRVTGYNCLVWGGNHGYRGLAWVDDKTQPEQQIPREPSSVSKTPNPGSPNHGLSGILVVNQLKGESHLPACLLSNFEAVVEFIHSCIYT